MVIDTMHFTPLASFGGGLLIGLGAALLLLANGRIAGISGILGGLLLGCGLILSGMSNPAKVLAFLDLGGRWDPSLAFVMLGAILVAAVAFRVGGARARTVFGGTIHLPGAARVDTRLVLGSVVFG